MAGLVQALVQYFSEILIVEEVSRQYYSVIAATGSISHVIIAWKLGSFALHQAFEYLFFFLSFMKTSKVF